MAAALLVLAGGFGIPAGAEVYRWIDSDGQVNFGSQPPVGVPTETVTIPPPPPMPEAGENPAPGEAQTTDDRETVFRRNCQIAKENLAKLQSNSKVTVPQADGTTVTLDAEQRAARIAETRREIEQYCPPG